MNRSLLILALSLIIAVTKMLGQSVNWQTYFEESNYLRTPRYEESIKYFEKLAEYSPYAKIFTFGISAQGREIKCMVVSKEKLFDAEDAISSGKPVILILNGIHAGEIEGKDASMMLLREILVSKEKEHLLDNVILLFIPIFNVDGHERMDKYNRINQNGPEEMGWRTTSLNYNLNRDFVKADAPEMRAFLKLYNNWKPHFFIDNHTTNGADYQYTITYGVEKYGNIDSNISEWVGNEFIPFLENRSNEDGYLATTYVSFRNWREGFPSGISDYYAPPRFSTGYAAAQNRLSLLVETHMLKPFKERVFATKSVIESVILYVSKNPSRINELITSANNEMIRKYISEKQPYPLNIRQGEGFLDIQFKGITSEEIPSQVSGALKTVYTGRDTILNVKFYNEFIPADSINVPKGYYIPTEYSYLVNILHLHGIKVDTIKENITRKVKRYHFNDVKFASAPYEGRHRVSFSLQNYTEDVIINQGTFFVASNQPAMKVILALLEPLSEDSFVKWGYISTIFEQKEYFESYVMEKIAQEMLSSDEVLASEFMQKLESDEKFRNSPYERLNFFYQRSHYKDKQHNVYPILISE